MTFFYPKNPKPGYKYPAVGWGMVWLFLAVNVMPELIGIASWCMYVCADHRQGASSGNSFRLSRPLKKNQNLQNILVVSRPQLVLYGWRRCSKCS